MKTMAARVINVVVVAIILLTGALPLLSDEGAVLADFKRFAEQENTRLRATFEVRAGQFIVDPVGKLLPLTLPRKYQFSGVQLESAPATFSYDVRRTDSLVTPYVGHLEWPLVFLRATTHAKGPAEFCNQRPLTTCIQHEGKIVETEFLYKNSAVRVPKTVRYEYVYQDGQWKSKRDLDSVLAEIVASLEATSPVPPSQAPAILGVPTPAQPSPTPTESGDPTKDDRHE
jgi:hypothetical protein